MFEKTFCFFIQASASATFDVAYRLLKVYNYFGKDGDKTLNIKAVAEKAGVSVATVSRVLNHPDVVSEKTKDHIIDVMKEMDYMPNWFARNLHMNKTNLIALLVPDILDHCYMELA